MKAEKKSTTNNITSTSYRLQVHLRRLMDPKETLRSQAITKNQGKTRHLKGIRMAHTKIRLICGRWVESVYGPAAAFTLKLKVLGECPKEIGAVNSKTCSP